MPDTTYVIDKFRRRHGRSDWELALTDPMPSRDFAIEKLASHRDSLKPGAHGLVDAIEVTCNLPTRLGFVARSRYGVTTVLWRIRNAERQPECVPVWANVIDHE